MTLGLVGCNNNNSTSMTLPSVEKPNLETALKKFKNGTVLPSNVLLTIKDANGKAVNVYQGGYGSDAFVNPNNPTQFYALTDRGSRADKTIEKGKGKAFPMPNHTPNIGLFQLGNDGKITLVKMIELKCPDGVFMSRSDDFIKSINYKI